jgi:hypothetical protein
MKPLIPIPHFDNIPPYENREAFCQLLDDMLGRSYKEAAGLDHIGDPLRAPPDFLAPMIEMFGGMEPEAGDGERTLRAKAYNAQITEFNRSTWRRVKTLIDAVTMMDAKIYHRYTHATKNDWSWRADAPVVNSWGMETVSQFLSNWRGFFFGCMLFADNANYISAEQIWIDAGGFIDGETVDKIAAAVAPQLPAYLWVTLGYTSGDDYYILKELN